MKVSGIAYGFLFSACVAVVMSLSMSFFMLWLNIGMVPGFIFIWLKSSGVGFVVSLPIAVTIIPLIEKALHKVFKVV